MQIKSCLSLVFNYFIQKFSIRDEIYCGAHLVPVFIVKYFGSYETSGQSLKQFQGKSNPQSLQIKNVFGYFYVPVALVCHISYHRLALHAVLEQFSYRSLKWYFSSIPFCVVLRRLNEFISVLLFKLLLKIVIFILF